MVCNINDIDGETLYLAFTSGVKGTLVQTVFQKDHDKPIATNTVWAFEGDDLIAPSNGITIRFANLNVHYNSSFNVQVTILHNGDNAGTGNCLKDAP